MREDVTEIKKSITSQKPTVSIGSIIDYDKLAEAVADELAKRMAD